MCDETWFDKGDLVCHWGNRGYEMSDNAANARVSELVGLNVLKMIRYPDNKYHSTDDPPLIPDPTQNDRQDL